MGLKDIDIGEVLRRLAAKRIEEAIEAGKFDNLPGAGKPQYLEPLPADEDARAMWWALRILRNADVQTDEMRYRRQIATLRTRIALTSQEEEMICLVREHSAEAEYDGNKRDPHLPRPAGRGGRARAVGGELNHAPG